MKDGFLKVGAASPFIVTADCERNADSIISVMEKAAGEGVKLLVLPELCVTGGACGDLFYHSALIEAADKALKAIASASAENDMLTVAGLPALRNGRLQSCAAFLLRGEVVALATKNTSDRRFASCDSKTILRCETMPELTIGFEGSGASVIIAPYAECELAGSADKRLNYARVVSERDICAYIAAGAGIGESTTDAVFGGHNIIAENGHILAENSFSDGLVTAVIDLGALSYARRKRGFNGFDEKAEAASFSLDVTETELKRDFRRQPFVPDGEALRRRREEVFRIQYMGLCGRIRHISAKKLVVGVSGGLDSTLALLVSIKAAEAAGLPRDSVIAVTMPCFGTSERTKSSARKLCESLDIPLRQVDITEAVRRHFSDIEHNESVHDVVFENSQARERTQVLMDIANGESGLVVGTGDLSELALGFATYNGDHMSMYGVNASVPKTLIRAMILDIAESVGGGLRDTLIEIARTPVSPELLPPENGEIAQKTEDIIGSYELNDFLLYHMISRGYSPKKLLRAAQTAFPEYGREALKERIRLFCGRFFSQQYKRSCLPDGAKTGAVSLSPRGDFAMPSDASAAVWLAQLEAL